MFREMEDLGVKLGGGCRGSERWRISGCYIVDLIVQSGRKTLGFRGLISGRISGLRGSKRWMISEVQRGGGYQGFRQVEDFKVKRFRKVENLKDSNLQTIGVHGGGGHRGSIRWTTLAVQGFIQVED